MIHDPALDSAGRYGEFLDKAIAEFKAKDAAPMEDTKTITPPPIPAAKPTVPAVGKAPLNKFQLIAQKVAGAQKKMNTRADHLLSRIEDFDKKIDSTFDKQEGAVLEGENAMDSLDASLAHVGNESDPNA